MDAQSKWFAVVFLCIITLLVNLPFGFARSKTRRYSFRWFLYVHMPIPLIFIIRNLSHIELKYIPAFVIAAFAGQLIGGKLQI